MRGTSLLVASCSMTTSSSTPDLQRNRPPEVKIGGKLVEVADSVGEKSVQRPRRNDKDAAGEHTSS